jgi:hypothetical protein
MNKEDVIATDTLRHTGWWLKQRFGCMTNLHRNMCEVYHVIQLASFLCSVLLPQQLGLLHCQLSRVLTYLILSTLVHF